VDFRPLQQRISCRARVTPFGATAVARSSRMAACPQPPAIGGCALAARLFLRIRHIRNAVRLASFRQRDPSISQACVMFPLLRVVRLLRQCRAPGGPFPMRFGSWVASGPSPFRLPQPHKLYNAIIANCASRDLSLFLAEERIVEAGNRLAPAPTYVAAGVPRIAGRTTAV
jgi:hypothetical protein